MKLLLDPISVISEVRGRKSAWTWLEVEEWTELDQKDGNEDWVAIRSEKRDADDWVDLGLRGDVFQHSDSGEVGKRLESLSTGCREYSCL